MKTLVTGGAGFIGSHLVRTLVESGEEVVVLDSLEEQVHHGVVPEMPPGVELIIGNVGDAELANRALAGVDRVVHLAAAVGVGQSMYEIARYTQLNTMATASFLERIVAQRPMPIRMVVASSMSIYGEGECGAEWLPIGTSESKPLIPTSIYAINKRDHEEMCLVTGAAYGIPTVALRFFNVYGPGQAVSNPYTGVAAIFASRLMNRRPPVVFEDGLQSRDFTHVSDIVQGILLALESDDAVGHAVNLGTGATTVADVARVISAGLELDIEPQYRQQYRAGDIRHCFAGPTEAERVLGFKAKTLFEDGMAELIAWLEEQRANDQVDAATEELLARGLAR
jgi:dTDP-L-rhamnose 4-epimerase